MCRPDAIKIMVEEYFGWKICVQSSWILEKHMVKLIGKLSGTFWKFMVLDDSYWEELRHFIGRQMQ